MRIVIMGPAGKMGRLVVREALRRRPQFMIVGGVVPEGRDYVRLDIGKATGDGFVGALVYDHLEWIIPVSEGVIDFTTPECTMETIKECIDHNKPLVIGTTGFSEIELKRIEHAATKIPILIAATTSTTDHLMYEFVKKAAKVLDKADVEIIDMHDRNKNDAPSGTAVEMGKLIAEARGQEFNEVADFGRDSKREEGHIGFHSVSSGDITSTHTVIFGMEGERLEITHRAYNFEIYANGALDAMLFLKGKPPGLYTFNDVLEEKARKAEQGLPLAEF